MSPENLQSPRGGGRSAVAGGASKASASSSADSGGYGVADAVAMSAQLLDEQSDPDMLKYLTGGVALCSCNDGIEV